MILEALSEFDSTCHSSFMFTIETDFTGDRYGKLSVKGLYNFIDKSGFQHKIGSITAFLCTQLRTTCAVMNERMIDHSVEIKKSMFQRAVSGSLLTATRRKCVMVLMHERTT
jgi:hypothetical protein